MELVASPVRPVVRTSAAIPNGVVLAGPSQNHPFGALFAKKRVCCGRITGGDTGRRAGGEAEREQAFWKDRRDECASRIPGPMRVVHGSEVVAAGPDLQKVARRAKGHA